MNLKILNGEHFIVSVDGERIGGALFAYLPSSDAIVINNKYRHLEKLVELMVVYLELPDQVKKETKEYAAKNAAIQEYLNILDQITRIRRRLYQGRQRRQRLLHRFSACTADRCESAEPAAVNSMNRGSLSGT